MLTLTETQKTRNSTVQLTEDDLLRINFDANTLILAEDVHELLDITHKMGHGRKFKKLITLGEYTSADLAAIRLAGSEEGCKYKIAEAYVIKGLAQRILVNFYMSVIKPLNPTKFFTNETDAQNWLLSLE